VSGGDCYPAGFGFADWTLPLCTNVICTSPIVGRIQYTPRDTTLYGFPRSSGTRKAINIIFENGMLSFMVLFIFTAVYGFNHTSEDIMVEIATQTYVSRVSL
jgi:hypothetical protein